MVVVPPENLLEMIRSFPLHRDVEHCGTHFAVSPFDYYAECPRCGTRVKVRSFSSNVEIEDIFDAVFEWMNQPGAGEVAKPRRATLEAEE